MNVIEWCNNNSGFVSAILSVVGIMISVIAVVVSIHTARMPYAKKIALSAGNYFTTDGSFGYHVSATNVGNRPVLITKIGFSVGDKIMVNPRTIGESQKILHTAENTSQYFSIEEMKSGVSRLNGKVYAYVEDSEGKTYKKYLCRVDDIKRIQ